MPDRRSTFSDGSARAPEAAWFAVFFVSSLVFYARAVGFDFVDFDDRRILLSHPTLFNDASFAASLRAIFIDYFPREEPLLLRDVSWALDARLFGLQNPLGFHLGNVVLNALNVGLFFLLMRRWIGDLRIALWVAAFFAVLPVHVEAVCWVMGRKDMLAATFMLAGLLAQTAELSGSGSGSSPRRWLWRGLVLLCTTCALFSKASSVAFVLVLILHRVFHSHLGSGRDLNSSREPSSGEDSSPREENGATVSGTPRESVRGHFLAVLPPVLATVAFLYWYHGILSDWGVIESTSPGPASAVHLEKVATFLPLLLGRYLLSIVGVVQLSMFYRWPHVAIPLTPFELVDSALIALAIVCGLILLWRRRRDLAFYMVAGLALLAPYSGLQYVGFWSADRYLYLASGFALATIVIPLGEWAQRSRRAQVAVVTFGLGFFVLSSAQAWLQQGVWQNNETLWSYEAYREDPSLLSIQALAKHYVKRAQAVQDPAERSAWVHLAELEIDRGFARHEELGLRPSSYQLRETLHLGRLHYLRGRVLDLQGAPIEKQLVHFRHAFRIAPDRLTAMLISSGLFEMAVREPEQAKRQQMFERSFQAFVLYIEMGRRDPKRLAQSRELLARNYEGRFPFLEEQIAEVKRIYFQ